MTEILFFRVLKHGYAWVVSTGTCITRVYFLGTSQFHHRGGMGQMGTEHQLLKTQLGLSMEHKLYWTQSSLGHKFFLNLYYMNKWTRSSGTVHNLRPHFTSQMRMEKKYIQILFIKQIHGNKNTSLMGHIAHLNHRGLPLFSL